MDIGFHQAKIDYSPRHESQHHNTKLFRKFMVDQFN